MKLFVDDEYVFQSSTCDQITCNKCIPSYKFQHIPHWNSHKTPSGDPVQHCVNKRNYEANPTAETHRKFIIHPVEYNATFILQGSVAAREPKPLIHSNGNKNARCIVKIPHIWEFWFWKINDPAATAAAVSANDASKVGIICILPIQRTNFSEGLMVRSTFNWIPGSLRNKCWLFQTLVLSSLCRKTRLGKQSN